MQTFKLQNLETYSITFERTFQLHSSLRTPTVLEKLYVLDGSISLLIGTKKACKVLFVDFNISKAMIITFLKRNNLHLSFKTELLLAFIILQSNY